MKLMFIYGLPGTGKLTVARELEKLTGFRVFHNHLVVDLAVNVFEFGSKPFSQLREKIWLNTFQLASWSELEGLIFTFAFEKSVADDFIDKVKDTLSERDEICFVKLICSKEELERRIENKSRKKYGKLSSADEFSKLLEQGAFREPELGDNVLEIDNTDLTAKRTAEQIIEHYNLCN